LCALYRLALALHTPVSQLDISWDEFAHWVAFEKSNPFPSQINEFMLAQLTTIVVSYMSKSKPKTADFMLSELLKKPVGKNKIDQQILNVFSNLGKKDG